VGGTDSNPDAVVQSHVLAVSREPSAAGRVAELTLEMGETLTTPLLPGLDLPLSKIFEE
jgi:hypothetical protein